MYLKTITEEEIKAITTLIQRAEHIDLGVWDDFETIGLAVHIAFLRIPVSRDIDADTSWIISLIVKTKEVLSDMIDAKNKNPAITLRDFGKISDQEILKTHNARAQEIAGLQYKELVKIADLIDQMPINNWGKDAVADFIHSHPFWDPMYCSPIDICERGPEDTWTPYKEEEYSPEVQLEKLLKIPKLVEQMLIPDEVKTEVLQFIFLEENLLHI